MLRLVCGLISSVTVALAFADGVVKDDPAAEVTKFEKQMENAYNSPEFLRNPQSLLAYFGRDMRLFDIALPGDFRGEAFRERFVAVGNQFQGTVKFIDMTVSAAPRLAFVSFIQHYVGKDKSGKPFDLMLRTTDCLEKSDGSWLIVHEHVSLALDEPTLAAVLFKKP